jgi:hypothetical protein
MKPKMIAPLVLLLILVAITAHADFVPVYHPEMTVTRAAGAIAVDGRLGDAGWQGAARADNFAEHSPGDQIEPPVDTEAFITYDDDNVYVAFVCYDEPSTIRASLCPRDKIFQDDNIIFCVDTFGDAANAYEFAVNPYGIQGDLYYSSSTGEDWRYDIIYESAGRITDEGWVVEMAIPFSSLRFPDTAEQVWRVDFWRNHPRDVRSQMSWAAYDRDESCWPCQWGTLRGIENVSPGRGLDILPSLVAHQSGARGDDGRFENGDIDGDVAVSVKYAPSSNTMLEATMNPDFSQVESDAAQIDVNTNFALSYSEKRPFFQEGADLFDTWFEAVYTRSINDPSAAGKLTGRTGGTSYALLSALDEHSPVIVPFEEHSRLVLDGQSLSNILRVKHDLGEQTHIGLLATDRRYDGGGSGTLAGLDTRVRFDKMHQIEVQYLASFTEEPDDTLMTEGYNQATFDDGRLTEGFDGESFDGHGLYSSFERHGNRWSYDLEFWERSPTYRADNGYEVVNNRRTGNVESSYLFRFDESPLLEWIQPSLSTARNWNYDGQLKDEYLSISLSTRMRYAQTNSHSRYWAGSEVYDGVSYKGLYTWHFCGNSRPNDLIIYGGSANYGHRVVYDEQAIGRQSDYTVWFDLKPVDRMLLETRITYAQSKAMNADTFYYKGYVARSKITLQVTRELSARLVIQYNDFAKRWEADPLLTYQIDPFSIFYIGSTRDYRHVTPNTAGPDQWRLTDRQYFMKLQYLFRI